MNEFQADESTTLIAFRRVSEPWGGLGNMAPVPVEFEGRSWRTVEALFQAQRFSSENPVREAIWSAKSPMAAKMIAKKHRNERVVEAQSTADVEIMRELVRLKLEQHLRGGSRFQQEVEALLRVPSFLIIEDCTARPNTSGLFWGAQRKFDSTWRGENTLGQIWMELLAALR